MDPKIAGIIKLIIQIDAVAAIIAIYCVVINAKK